MVDKVRVYGAYIYGYGREYYIVEFNESKLILCKVFEKLDIKRHRYNHKIDDIVRRVRIIRGSIGECREIPYSSIRNIRLKTLENEVVLTIDKLGGKIVIHFPRIKEKLVRKGVRLIKKYIGV